MPIIHKLDRSTIDLIAAGEVIERPGSVVKELVENAIDAGAKAITVEIRGGGIEMIRITDDGCGIDAEQVRIAFESHATSKINSIDDLFSVRSLGFRGEALASVAAVAKVDMTTKTESALTGVHYSIYGGAEVGMEEIGAPVGTTIVVRDLFYNTPARRKFLKNARTEGGYIGDIMERFALGFPDISFHFIRDRKDVLSTGGTGDYKEMIYRVFGRDVSGNVIPFFSEEGEYTLTGYLGKPLLNRSNRNQEIFFVNGRSVRDKVLSKALEEGYREYLMQHKFPFAVLMLTLPPDMVDVNAHPSKMEVRFHDAQTLSAFVSKSVKNKLAGQEMIPEVTDDTDTTDHKTEGLSNLPEPFENERRKASGVFSAGVNRPDLSKTGSFRSGKNMDYQEEREIGETDDWFAVREETPVLKKIFPEGLPEAGNPDSAAARAKASPIIKQDRQVFVESDVQMNLFDVHMLTDENRPEYQILGQVFDTYWILAFRDKMFIVDQHAAHEKVNFERMMKRFRNRDMMSQLVSPPLIITMTEKEETVYLDYESVFDKLGFKLDHFGAHSYAMRAVPLELYGVGEKDMFLAILDELSDEGVFGKSGDSEFIINHIATKACKASVKGNTRMTFSEMEALIDELLTLDNPYNCPHGRPTIISMSKYEIDRKFKRIV